jgi:hypothetical protein
MLSSKAGGCTAAVSFGNRTPREHSKEALQLAAFFLFTTSPIGTLRTRWAGSATSVLGGKADHTMRRPTSEKMPQTDIDF